MKARRFILLCAGLLYALSAAVGPAGAADTDEAVAEADFLRLINERRARLDLAPLDVYWDLVDDARAHSHFQSQDRCGDAKRICHNPELGSVTDGWYALAENVGVGYDVDGLDRAFWESPAHQQNVVGNFNYAGVGVVVRDDGSMYVTVVFMRGPAGLPAERPDDVYSFPAGADRPGVHDPGRSSWSLYGESRNFYYGLPDDVPLTCDWDGRDGSSVGLYRNETGFLYLRNQNAFGDADLASFYGTPVDVPLCGDWDGDGAETIGVYRPGTNTFYLHNRNALGLADAEIVFGEPGDVPLVGDWFGAGYDSVAVYRPANRTLYLADGSLRLGNVVAIPGPVLAAGDQLVVGDWDADGADTPGVYRPDTGEFWVHHGLTAGEGSARIQLPADGVAVVGSW